MHDFLAVFERALDAAEVACLLVAAPTEASDQDLSAIAQPLIRAAQARDVAALLPGRPTLVKTLGADGAHLDLRALAPNDALRLQRYTRKELPENAICGVLCPPERHLAMEVAEDGADYIGFDLAGPEAAEILAWWGEMMTVPCIAFGPIDPATATALAQGGADFIAPDASLWASADPVQDLAALQAAIHG